MQQYFKNGHLRIVFLFFAFISGIYANNKMPSFFSSDTWDEIDKINQSIVYDKYSFATVADGGPIQYIGALKNKEYKFKKNSFKIEKEYILDAHHGTQVASLIVGDKYEHNGKYISGIARKMKIINLPIHAKNDANEDNLDFFVKKIKNLRDKAKNSKAISLNFPSRMIYNFSFGPSSPDWDKVIESWKLNDNKKYPDDFYGFYLDHLKKGKDLSFSKKKGNMDLWNDFVNEKGKVITEIKTKLSKLHEENGRYLINELINEDNLIFVAAGNEGKELPYQGLGPTVRRLDTTKFDPVIRVAAHCEYNALCDFSNYLYSLIDIASPGKLIPVMTYTNDFKPFIIDQNGTSFSSPIVAGVASLMLQCNPQLEMKEIKNIILNTTNTVETLQKKIINGRTLNAKKALEKACYTQMPKHATKPKIKRNNNDDEKKRDL
ncbi:S8 family serine peptidase [Cysteiniphilum sp. 6C5]|uniref:S8 family serine peptidase n=1 Tax=unclassified Cysteiniphilum TaxID=2610889 RepID=UPI003F87A172